ncbi:MAG: alpha/beta hydrolase [Nanoarchaeota archaeon]|nr:alpha/beta hydrolase [Nanoarchaeota archaeon]MBU0977699.1 alpha/beta hydrolase [Nanoarchaeota archaeon]
MKLKKRTVYLTVLIIIFILALFYFLKTPKEIYKVEGNTLSYAENRPKPNYQITLNSTTQNLEIYNINFESRPFLDQETTIHALLFLPKDKQNLPGLVFLSGGGVTKEAVSNFSSRIAELGYAILVIDQRGLGETGGAYLPPQQDYQFFTQGEEPIQHLSVYDALASFDVLKVIPEVDKNNIALMGESMGARYAIIATALDDRIKGLIVISGAGFNIDINPIQQGNDYLVSIDPDHYISKISPRPVFFLQGTNDTVVPLQNAQNTFNKAKEPKYFFKAEDCSHGFCEEMWDELKNDLETISK